MNRLAGIVFATASLLAPGIEAFAQVKQPHVYGKVVVLCIGIERYQHTTLPPAPGAESDAKAVGEALSRHYGYSIEPLIGPQATRKAILDRLSTLGEKLEAEDVLIVFFAGHGQVIQRAAGVREGYLIPYQANLDLNVPGDPDKWKSQALEMSDLTRITEKFRAKHVLFLVDACCSGYMTRRGNSLEFRYDLRKLLDLRSRMVVSATTESEAATSRKRDGEERGIFTSALLHELDSNQANSVSDVFIKLRKKVIFDSNENMTPQIAHFGDANRDQAEKLRRDDGEFVFLPLAIPEADVARTVRPRPRGAEGVRHVLSDVIDRANERFNLQTKVGDVIEAFEARDYRFTASAARLQTLWTDRRKQFEENAALGDVMAMAGMHYCLSKGLGGEKDDPKAYHWAKIGYDTGYPAGKHIYGRCLFNNIVVPRNPIAAVELFKEATEAQNPFPISYFVIGQDFYSAKDYAKAREIWEKAADAGVDSASVMLAELDLKSAPGFPKDAKADVPAALRHLAPALAHNHADAQFVKARIAAFHLTPPDHAEAARMLTEAARNGHPRAQGTLARELGGSWMVKKDLPFDLGLTPNPNQAVRWAGLAADQNDGYGLLVMACTSEDNENFPKAIEYCVKAKDLKYLHASILESQWYLGGKVYPKDKQKGYDAARFASDTGDNRGRRWLAAIYADGNVPIAEMAKGEDGQFTSVHHALHLWTLAAMDDDAISHEAIRKFAKDVKADPKLPYWKLFQTIYPEDVAEFWEHVNHDP